MLRNRGRNDTKKQRESMCGTLKLLTKTQQNKTTAIEDNGGKQVTGNLLTESSETLCRWAEYCKITTIP